MLTTGLPHRPEVCRAELLTPASCVTQERVDRAMVTLQITLAVVLRQ